MNKHTPGPWIHTEDDDNYHAVTAGCGYHVNSDDDGFEIAGCISKANAHLIAAAPDLLEALEYCLDCLGDEFALPADCQSNARAAIDRARGEA